MSNPNSYAVTQAKPMVYANWSCLVPRNLLEPLLGTLTWNFGTFWNLHLEPLWNLGTCWNLYAQPWLGTLELSETLPVLGIPFWNLDWELLLGTLQPLQPLLWNLGTSWNPYLEPQNLRSLEPLVAWNLYLEPWNLLDLWLATLTCNLGTFWNLHLEPLLGTSDPRGTLRDDCPRVPQGLPSLAETPKLSFAEEKNMLRTFNKHLQHTDELYQLYLRIY